VYFNVNFKFSKFNLLVSELYRFQNARSNDKKKVWVVLFIYDIFHNVKSLSENIRQQLVARMGKNAMRSA